MPMDNRAGKVQKALLVNTRYPPFLPAPKGGGTRGTRVVRCVDCALPHALCICSELPRIHNRTPIALVVHHDETHKPTSSGRFLANVLTRCEVHVRGAPTQEHVHLNLPPNAAVLFPSPDALELGEQFMPSMLVVPEANWGQAQRVIRRVKGLAELPRVKLAVNGASARRLRESTRLDSLPTAEAVLRALTILDGLEVGGALDAAYTTWFRRFALAKLG